MKRILQSQLRLLVAALALAAAGTASAQITSPASSNGTDLYFYAFDSATGTSFIEDLGTNMGSFTPTSAAGGTAFSTNVAANAAWTTYVNTTEADSVTDNLGATGTGYATGTQNTFWAVISGIAPGGTNASTYSLATTMTNGSTPVSQTLASTRSAITDLGNFTGALSGLLASAPTSGYFDANTTVDNPGVQLGAGNGTINNLLKVSNLNAIGTASNFYLYSGNKTGIPTAYSNTFSFDGTNLAYGSVVAAVPEPSSYLMMLAGLLMVAGLVARRRNSGK